MINKIVLLLGFSSSLVVYCFKTSFLCLCLVSQKILTTFYSDKNELFALNNPLLCIILFILLVCLVLYCIEFFCFSWFCSLNLLSPLFCFFVVSFIIISGSRAFNFQFIHSTLIHPYIIQFFLSKKKKTIRTVLGHIQFKHLSNNLRNYSIIHSLKKNFLSKTYVYKGKRIIMKSLYHTQFDFPSSLLLD